MDKRRLPLGVLMSSASGADYCGHMIDERRKSVERVCRDAESYEKGLLYFKAIKPDNLSGMEFNGKKAMTLSGCQYEDADGSLAPCSQLKGVKAWSIATPFMRIRRVGGPLLSAEEAAAARQRDMQKKPLSDDEASKTQLYLWVEPAEGTPFEAEGKEFIDFLGRVDRAHVLWQGAGLEQRDKFRDALASFLNSESLALEGFDPSPAGKKALKAMRAENRRIHEEKQDYKFNPVHLTQVLGKGRFDNFLVGMTSTLNKMNSCIKYRSVIKPEYLTDGKYNQVDKDGKPKPVAHEHCDVDTTHPGFKAHTRAFWAPSEKKKYTQPSICDPSDNESADTALPVVKAALEQGYRINEPAVTLLATSTGVPMTVTGEKALLYPGDIVAFDFTMATYTMTGTAGITAYLRPRSIMKAADADLSANANPVIRRARDMGVKIDVAAMEEDEEGEGEEGGSNTGTQKRERDEGEEEEEEGAPKRARHRARVIDDEEEEEEKGVIKSDFTVQVEEAARQQRKAKEQEQMETEDTDPSTSLPTKGSRKRKLTK